MALLATEGINEERTPNRRASLGEKLEPGTVVQVPVVDQRGGIGPPPNGGVKAWIQVLSSFFLFFNS
jgi:hypothetical protein